MSMHGLVSIDRVTRTYPSRGGTMWILRDVSLQVPAGSLVVLMGPSGSGKTTLLNIIGGLDAPSTGRVSVLGQDMETLSASARTILRRNIGFIFQSFALLPTATAFENVELGLRVAGTLPQRTWATHARRSLADVGLSAWADHRPGELSGGQQQRVAIARALASEPRLVLADEPTGDLDSQLADRVIQLLRNYAQRTGAACVVASHDPAVAAAADQLYILENGTLVGHLPRDVTPQPS